MPTPKANNFILLRLFFAAMVILSHAPEQLDHNRSREIATQIWGTLSFGEIAVDGFFLISGYLITQSFISDPHFWRYLAKRVLRIYPAFLVVTGLLLLVVAPIAGAHPWSTSEAVWAPVRALFLQRPIRYGAFAGVPSPDLDGPLWTISFEFRCYLLVPIMAAIGLLKRPAVLAVVAFALLVANGLGFVPQYAPPHHLDLIFGDLRRGVRLMGVFLTGASFFLLRDRIKYNGYVAAACFAGLLVLLKFPATAETALALLGGYAIFWTAFKAPLGAISGRITDDVSYGLYISAWPIANLLIYFGVLDSPWSLAAATLVLAAIFGFVSWRLVERPALSLKPTSRRSGSPDAYPVNTAN